ncbi:hypothetical protein MKW94_009716 [Papaver nudicaule]|uniref:Phosphatidic acid phosphatase type 2/haloperoxidase domain-containing protein n=1 Tax=Papaver nudicaule TaxID=74823 RepID=A0AA41RRP2_PAPNU|nr:hypothetical protein [Papaver nudicaule]
MFATSISFKPLLRLSPLFFTAPSRLIPLKPVSNIGVMSKRVDNDKNRVVGSKTMTEMTKVSGSGGDGNFEITENEAILGNGSSEFPREFVVLSRIESTINHLSKWLVVTVFGIIVIWRHDALAMWAAMGAVVNAWLSITLKRILNQERPVATLGSGPGMPSSHAQSIFFASVFAILSLVKSLGLNGVTVTIGVLGLAFGSYLSWLRISQRHHTISQVVVGAILGTICSILWFQSWYGFVLNAFLSFLWVRIVIVLGGVVFCVIFMLYVIKNWLLDGNED